MTAMDRLLSFERMINAGSGLSRKVGRAPFAAWAPAADATGSHDRQVVLDLTDAPHSGDEHHWSLRFDGQPGEAAGFAALRSGGSPEVTIIDGAGRVIVRGIPGSETPGALAAAFDDLLSGCITLIIKALTGLGSDEVSTSGATESVAVRQGAAAAMITRSSTARTAGTSPEAPAPEGDHPGGNGDGALIRHVVRTAGHTALHKAYRTLYRAPHWRVGWRWADGPGLLDDPEHPPTGWTDMPDDGLHFYADPFPYEYDGRHFLFVEDFEHRHGRGVISVTEFDENGPIHRPAVALTHDVHLSYPFVVADQGEVWMIPETSGAGTVELYRATGFPYSWTRERVLLSGLEASDATVFRHQDRWWITATVRDGGSFSDALHLWSADQLTGPWRPHPQNPVLVDISAARPAGRVEMITGPDGDRLIRPVQDGRTGYGAGLAIAEITALDEDRFEQNVLARLSPGSWWPGRRIHTINRSGRLECIDGSAFSPRFRRRPGLPEGPA